MSYTDADVSAANAAMDKYRSGLDYEVGAALAVVGLSAERACKEIDIRNDMIRTAIAPAPRCDRSPRRAGSAARRSPRSSKRICSDRDAGSIPLDTQAAATGYRPERLCGHVSVVRRSPGSGRPCTRALSWRAPYRHGTPAMPRGVSGRLEAVGERLQAPCRAGGRGFRDPGGCRSGWDHCPCRAGGRGFGDLGGCCSGRGHCPCRAGGRGFGDLGGCCSGWDHCPCRAGGRGFGDLGGCCSGWDHCPCRAGGRTACTVRDLIDGHTEASGHSDPPTAMKTAGHHSPREGQGDRCTGSGYACVSPAHERAGNHAAHGSAAASVASEPRPDPPSSDGGGSSSCAPSSCAPSSCAPSSCAPSSGPVSATWASMS